MSLLLTWFPVDDDVGHALARAGHGAAVGAAEAARQLQGGHRRARPVALHAPTRRHSSIDLLLHFRAIFIRFLGRYSGQNSGFCKFLVLSNV